MRLLVDVDGVLADIHTPWLEMYNRAYGDDLRPEDLKSHDLHNHVKPECGEKIYDFLERPELYETARPIPGAVEALEELNRDALTPKDIERLFGFAPIKKCREWIKHDWPHAPLSDDELLVWKRVRIDGDGVPTGWLDCPYPLGQIVRPRGSSFWLLSPLGTLKEEGYGLGFLVARAPVDGLYMTEQQVLVGFPPSFECIPLEFFSWEEVAKEFASTLEGKPWEEIQDRWDLEWDDPAPLFPISPWMNFTRYLAEELLKPENINRYAHIIDEFERRMRRKVESKMQKEDNNARQQTGAQIGLSGDRRSNRWDLFK